MNRVESRLSNSIPGTHFGPGQQIVSLQNPHEIFHSDKKGISLISQDMKDQPTFNFTQLRLLS